jgi:hypothetical protein
VLAFDEKKRAAESLRNETLRYPLICREAYTPASARAVWDYFVAQFGTACESGDASLDGGPRHSLETKLIDR